MKKGIREAICAARHGPSISAPHEAAERSALSGSPIGFGFAVAVVVFGTALVSQLVLFSESVETLKENIRGNLVRLAMASASVVDAERHKTFTDPSQEGTKEYKEAIEPLRRIVDSDPDIAFLYTCILRDGKVYFVLDPTDGGDTNGDGIDEKSHIMDPYDEAGPEIIRALRTGEPAADEEPYSDRWGTFISGYAPLRTESGELVGIIGVDLSAEKYAARLAGMRRARDTGIIVAGLVALVLGILAFALRRAERRMRLRAQKLEADHRLELTSALQRLEHAYKAADFSRTRFSQLFDGLPVPCLTFDADRKVFEWNRQALEHFGFSPHEALEQPLGDVLGEVMLGPDELRLVDGIFKGETFLDSEWSDGEGSFLVSGLPLRSPTGEITGGILTIVDVTRQKVAEARVQSQLHELHQAHQNLNKANRELHVVNRRLETLATTDPLTGLANSRALFDRLDEMMAEAESTGKPFAVVMTDVDHFKRVNDLHGHRAGDQVLKAIAELLKESTRPGDLAARYGGEEFCVLLSGVGEESAVKVAERMRVKIAKLNTEYGHITASFGVCEWQPSVANGGLLVQSADEALYAAKAAGRNRVIAATVRRKAA